MNIRRVTGIAAALLLLSVSTRRGANHPAHRPCGGSGHPRSDPRPHLCRPHRLRLVLRQAVRHRREAELRAAAGAVLHHGRRRQGGGDQAASEREVQRRRDVRCRGCKILARSARHVPDLVPQARARSTRPGRGGRSADHQARAQGALLAADLAAHRPRRHDGLAEGGQGSRRQVRTEAGLRRSLQVRRARAAGPHRVREIGRLLEQGQRLDRQDRLPADRRRHRAPRQPEVRRPRPDRADAGDRPQGGALRQPAEALAGAGARLSGDHAEHRQRQGKEPA